MTGSNSKQASSKKSLMKKRREGREEEVTDCDRILRTSEKKMMRSRREREREGESRVSLDDTAAADSREREPLWELLRMEWDGGLGEGVSEWSTVFLRTALVEL